MKNYKFQPITYSDIPAMAKLFQERQRQESSVLQNACLSKSYIEETLKALFEKNRMVGIGAFSDEGLVGYMMAKVEFSVEMGRHAWVPYEGMAVKAGESAEQIRHLYAEASQLWLQYGCFKHFAMVPLGAPAYYDAFQRLCFATEQVHGVMEMESYAPFDVATDVVIRDLNKNDRAKLGEMSSIIFSYQNASPTYAAALPESVMQIQEGYENIVNDEEATVILAEKNGEVVGFHAYWPQDPGLMAPDKAVELSVAGTLASEMGTGVGKALMDEGYKIMKEKSYQFMVADWRMANLASSTFWPKCGFQPIAYRMVRNIDERVAWANFENPLIWK
ncbi:MULTISPECIES: GNAT family N-acetyltransferase [unclassified Bacillus (in: firmicutes)]|uniref:GNAT family N-acetyltransferase n=1 Tax=unclassified Bacillus (in: firmicutes) TaxID=185979 RepID=UPI0008F0CCBB|nr:MULTISPECIES: GNAT family N-acetyltransferase [unclassified Bacillus (in: firmicutes)]SFB20239.1 L-amino acid N-acyltransferase YncA [Bacillus sp. UNCCL13]SFQ90840.1 L-amino acid N-acyltransferase YncA [Bacillus sp. cl95]